MRVTVVRPADLGPGEADLWARFQKTSPVMSSPFLSLTFSQIVGRARPGARVAVIESDGEITAFLPFELAARRIAMPIGYPMNDLQGLISSGAPVDARSAIRKAGLRGWRFIAVPAEQAALAPYHYRGTTVQAPVADLSNGYEAFIQSRSRSLVAETARKRRALERQSGAVSLEWSSPRPDRLRQLIDWKSGKYGGTRQLFSDPAAVRMVEEIAASATEDCQGLVSVLLAGERPVTIYLGMTGPRGLTGWFASYDSSLSRFSPGTIMFFAVAEEAARRGIATFELGYGQDGYKFRLANDSYPVAGGAVWASRAEEKARDIYRRVRRISPSAQPGTARNDQADR